jgi:arylformamidase
VELERTQDMDSGAHANVSRLACGTHTGTHVDAPLHFLRDGGSIDRVPPDMLVGPAWVADLTGVGRIRGEDLDSVGVPPDIHRLLLKTSNSAGLLTDPVFHTDYAGLEESGAEWMVRRGIRLVGNDYLSVAVRDKTGPVHRILLGAGVLLVEGLSLAEVPAGACRFFCLPLKLIGAEGAPARAIIERPD